MSFVFSCMLKTLFLSIFSIVGYVDHVTVRPMSVDIHPEDDSGEPAND